MDESRRRITRNAPEKAGLKEKATLKEDPAYVDKLINVTQATGQLFLFWESAPVLKIKDENKTELAIANKIKCLFSKFCVIYLSGGVTLHLIKIRTPPEQF